MRTANLSLKIQSELFKGLHEIKKRFGQTLTYQVEKALADYIAKVNKTVVGNGKSKK